MPKIESLARFCASRHLQLNSIELVKVQRMTMHLIGLPMFACRLTLVINAIPMLRRVTSSVPGLSAAERLLISFAHLVISERGDDHDQHAL